MTNLEEPMGLSHSHIDADAVLCCQALRPEQAELYLALVHVVIPHDQPDLRFPLYVTALTIESRMVGDLEFRAGCVQTLQRLDADARHLHGTAFLQLGDADRRQVAGEQQDTPFFQTLIHLLKADFYNRHLVWRVLGYPDLDHEGGYLDHGFGELPSLH